MHINNKIQKGVNLIIVLYFLFIPILTFSQPKPKYDVTGAWSGYVKTTDKKITYEVVISDSSGTYVGYSKIIFNNKGKEYSAIKSLSIRIEEEKYILEEEQLLSDNFENDAPRKIKQINTLDLVIGTKKMQFSGEFKTKATMGLKSATGEVFLQKAIVPDTILLFSELNKMGLTEKLSFVKEAKEQAAIAAATPQKPKDTVEIAAKTAVVINAPPPAKPPTPKPSIVRTTVNKPPTPVTKTSVAVAQKPTTVPAPVVPTPKIVRTPRPENVIATGSASDLNKRSIETIQTVYFKNDSLNLILYDNGEVDGDTVSVVVNGKVIMGKKGLSTKAVTETLYITPEMGDSLQMIMYAENLGAIAPNTGLLIVLDGKDRYEIRFSGDLNKNAAIIFKRSR
jgi:hypothetical protein